MTSETVQDVRYRLIHQCSRPNIPDVLCLARLLGIREVCQLFQLHEAIQILWQDNFVIRE